MSKDAYSPCTSGRSNNPTRQSGDQMGRNDGRSTTLERVVIAQAENIPTTPTSFLAMRDSSIMAIIPSSQSAHPFNSSAQHLTSDTFGKRMISLMALIDDALDLLQALDDQHHPVKQ